MAFHTWLRSGSRNLNSRKSRQRKAAQRKPSARLVVETLEGRIVPTTFNVPSLAFPTITSAITAANPAGGDLIVVAPGVYQESVTIDKPLTLQGAESGIAGGPGRGAESIIEPVGNTEQAVISVRVSGVTIDGFTIDGDDPGTTGGPLYNGQDTNTFYGVANVVPSQVHINNLLLENNIIENTFIGARLINPGTTPSTGSLITGNWFNNIGNSDFGYAVYMGNDFYADATHNLMTNVWTGFHLTNFDQTGGPTTWTISNNTIQSAASGLDYWGQFSHATPLTFTNNSISAATGAVANNFGILIVTVQDGVNPTFTGDTITGTNYGIGLTNVSGSNTITLNSTDTITGTTIAGVYLTDNLTFNPVGMSILSNSALNDTIPIAVNLSGISISAVSGIGVEVQASRGTGDVATTVTITGGTISDLTSTTGIDIEGPTAVVSLSGATVSGFSTGILDNGGTITFGAGDTITGGATGLAISGAAVVTGNTLDNLAFAGQTGQYIALSSAALAGQTLDATNATFGGVTGATAGLAGNFAIEDKITHALDDATLGFVRVTAGEVYVTPNSGSIQRGIDAASSGDTVNVEAGTYVADGDFVDNTDGVVSELNVDKPLTLLGPNPTFDPTLNTNPANAPAIILPGHSDPSPFSSTEVIIVGVNASNVTIEGFTINGSNPALNGDSNTIVYNGVSIDAAEGIASYDDVGNITVQGNVVENTAYTGIDFQNGANTSTPSAATSNNLITKNYMQNLGGSTFGYGVGVVIYNNFYAEVTDNVMNTVRVGVQTGNFSQANPGADGTAEIANNQIAAVTRGIFYNLHYDDASSFTVANNTITAVEDATSSTFWDGILIASQETDVSAIFSDNTIDGSATTSNTSQVTAGYNAWNTPTSGLLLVSGGSVSGVDYGVWVNTFEGDNGSADDTHLTVSGLSITASQIGVYVEDSPQNTITPTPTAAVSVEGGTTITTTGATGIGVEVSGTTASAFISASQIQNNTTGIEVNGGTVSFDTGDSISGGTTGLLISGTASVTGNTLNDLAFTGQTGNYIQLASGALEGAVLDATGATFGGVTGAGATPTQNVAIANQVFDTVEDGTLGLVIWKANTIFVDAIPSANATATDNNYTRIANSFNVLQSGYTIALDGDFDWTESHAMASWALGNDGVTGTTSTEVDDYSILAPANVNDVIVTATSLGDATIQGPGNVTGFIFTGPFELLSGSGFGDSALDTSVNQGWTFSNLNIFNFDIAINYEVDGGSSSAFQGTTIDNNHIVVASDIAADEDGFQNLGILYSFGMNQTIENNLIDLQGDGISGPGGNDASEVGLQSETSGGNTYDGLLITGNTVNILHAQSANPEFIIGYWENSYADNSNITISDNHFTNTTDAGNDPTLNEQQAFNATSTSSNTTTVTYSGNTVTGANTAFTYFQSPTPINNAGLGPVHWLGNTATDVLDGFDFSTNITVDYLSGNSVTGTGTAAGTGINIGDGSVLTTGVVSDANTVTSFGTGINVEGSTSTAALSDVTVTGNGTGVEVDGATATIQHSFINNNGVGILAEDDGTAPSVTASDNNLGLNTTTISNLSASAIVNASGNWFGSNVLGTISAGISGPTDYSPYLNLGTDTSAAPGFQGNFSSLTVHTAGDQVGATGRIQEGVNLVTAGGTVDILAGTYSGDVNVNKAATLAPGGSGHVATVTIDGNLTFSASGSTLQMDVNSPYATAGTDYDQLIVNGNVDFTNGTLSLTGGGAAASVTHRLTLISTTGTTIAGSSPAQGAAVTLGSNQFALTYKGGTDGNDVDLLVSGTITWATPAPITYGTALSGTQLDATDDAVGGGTFVYTPPSGTVLNAGANQILSTTFTPNDTLDYSTVTATVMITVNQAMITHIIGNDSHNYGSTANLAADLGTTFNTGILGQTLDITYMSSGNTTTTHVGMYSITGTVSDGSGLASNYMVTLTPGTLTVNPAPISFTIGNDSHAFGSTANLAGDLGTTIPTGINGQNLDISYSSTGNTPTAQAGVYPIVGILTNGTGLTSDYTVNLTPGTLTVTEIAPMVGSPTVAALGSLSATLGGTVTSNGGGLTKRGIVFSQTSLNGTPMLGGMHVTEVADASTASGTFAEMITGLTPGTEYSFSAFALNSAGVAYTLPATIFTTTTGPGSGISGVSSAFPGQSITYTLLASDPVPGTQTNFFVFHIKWGDGTTTTLNALSGATLSHTFANAGTYVTQVSATDTHSNVLPVGTFTTTIGYAVMTGTTLTIEGTSGNDTFALSAPSAGTIGVSVNGVNQGTFSPTTSVVIQSSGGTDTLVGPNTVSLNTWSLGVSKAGTLMNPALPTTVTFNGITNVTGGTGPDTFTVQTNSSGFGTVDGGTGANTLDYSLFTTGVTVNLSSNSATRLSSIANIGMVLGGTGNDTLTAGSTPATLVGGNGNDTLQGGSGAAVLLGGAGNDVLRAGSGRTLMVGGGGADTLFGGGADDILIGGVLSYYNEASGLVNTSALNAIMAEWTSADTFSNRIAALMNGGGFNGTSVLNGTTISDDGGAADSLVGGAGADWFITNTNDVVTGNKGGDVITSL